MSPLFRLTNSIVSFESPLPALPELPELSAVHLLHFNPVAMDFAPGTELATIPVAEQEAHGLVDLWRSIPMAPNSSLCHKPAFGFDFFRQGDRYLRCSICWECGNMWLVGLDTHGMYEFVPQSEQALFLLHDFEMAFWRLQRSVAPPSS